MTKEFCDLCGKEIIDCTDKAVYKIKRKVTLFDGYCWEKMTAHKSCWKDMCDYLKSLRIVEKENTTRKI